MTIFADGAFGGLDPNKRDNSPAGWRRTTLTPDISWKFHHMIAWEMLRDTWQGLLMCQWWLEVGMYMRALNTDERAIMRLSRGAMTRADRDELFAKLSWPAWNIVEGPADRDDEGGSEIDLFRFGLVGVEIGRMGAISALGQAMTEFLSHFNRPAMEIDRVSNRNVINGPSNYNPLTGAPASINSVRGNLLAALRAMAPFRHDTFIPYRDTMWKVTLAGRITEKETRAPRWARTPRFRKADGIQTRPVHAVPQVGLIECHKCRRKFTPTQAGPANTGTSVCPHCHANVYVAKSRFQDPNATLCGNCGATYAAPFGPAPCPRCYLMA